MVECKEGEVKIGNICHSNVEIIRMRKLMDLNESKGRYWFSPDTMGFFESRVGGYAYKKVGEDKAYFISSEKGPGLPRRYNLRVMDLDSGKVDTIGEFNKMSEKEANNELNNILEKSTKE